MAWTGIRVRGTDNRNIFESKEILRNPSQGMNPNRHLFGKRGEALWGNWAH